MARFFRIPTWLRRTFPPSFRVPLPSFRHVFAVGSILGLMILSYVAGAAVVHYGLPTSDYLRKAFIGAQAWRERGQSSTPGTASFFPDVTGTTVDHPDRTHDGFTLVTTNQGAQAALIDMRGHVVHRWAMPFRKAWPQAPHVKSPLPEADIYWFRNYLYPNGDLLAVYQTDNDTPAGYGLVKLDKDSKLLWSYPERVHHDVDVGEDGTIYTLAHGNLFELPEGMEQLPSPYTADYLMLLSAAGKELASIPLLEAFNDSPYSQLVQLSLMDRITVNTGSPFGLLRSPPHRPAPGLPQRPNQPMPPNQAPMAQDLMDSFRISGGAIVKGDLLHVNSVKVLKQTMAAKFPLFKPGQVLISLRTLDLLALVDPARRSVVWASQGIWRAQHDPEFLENGHILVYDNYGARLESRIIEYDPQTHAIAWSYGSENSAPFLTQVRGMKQHLANGNTLIVDPGAARLLEVTPEKKLAWEYRCSPDLLGPNPVTKQILINGAHRYRLDELPFLKGALPARP